MIERTLIILKPDAVQRGLIGRILSRFEDKGLKIVAARLRRLPRALVERHYEEHRSTAFYAGLVDYMTSGPVLLLCLEGPAAIPVCRMLMGKTFGDQSPPGTIRGDLSSSHGLNLVHGSASAADARREIELFFPAEDRIDYALATEAWTINAEDRTRA